MNKKQSIRRKSKPTHKERVGSTHRAKKTPLHRSLEAGSSESKSASTIQSLKTVKARLSAENSRLRANLKKLNETVHDLGSLLSSTEIAVVLLDTHLRVRRFTPAVSDLLQLSLSDTNRPLNSLRRKFADRNLMADVRAVLKNVDSLESEVVSESGRAYVRRALPYRSSGNRIDGVVLTFIDITRLKLAETALRTSEERHRDSHSRSGRAFRNLVDQCGTDHWVRSIRSAGATFGTNLHR